MKKNTMAVFWAMALVQAVAGFDFQPPSEDHMKDLSPDTMRGRRGVIEEEKYYNIHSDMRHDTIQHTPWLPSAVHSDDTTTKISNGNDVKEELAMHQTTETITDKPTGRGARASNENWVKLPFPPQDDQNRDNILTPPQPRGDIVNSRVPKVNFVTQNKPLEGSESRTDKEAVQRSSRTDNIRTEFVRPSDEMVKQKPVYPRQAVYYPDDLRRQYYDDRYYTDDLYRRDPYYDLYDRKRYYPGPRVDRYDDPYDNYVPRKPKRIIYYAHLPEVVRTPPSVDLRYRYTTDPYRRFDDDYYARTGRYDYRFRNRYPYAALMKDDRNYRDLAIAGTAANDKKINEKVTPTPILPKKDNKRNNVEEKRNVNRDNVNSHQYHESDGNYDQMTHKGFVDINRPEVGYYRFDEPLFQTVDEPYQRKY